MSTAGPSRSHSATPAAAPLASSVTSSVAKLLPSSPPKSLATSIAPTAHIDRFVIDRLPPPEQCAQLRYETPELKALAALSSANLVSILLDDAVAYKGWGTQPLLRSSKITLSFADVQARVNRIAQVLTEDLHLVPGNRVLLRGGNSIGMALAWLAVVKAGLIAVATMPLLRAKELVDIIDKAQPTVALCDSKLLDELIAAQQQSGVLQSIVPFNLMDDPNGLASRSALKNGVFRACPTAPHDPAMMAFTSGTTGKPKAAVHTHRDILAACEAWPRHVLRVQPSDIVVGSPPLAFTFGLGGLLVFPMWAGCSVYFPDAPYTPESMVDTINAVGATICYTAPTFYRQMTAFAQSKGVPSLRTSVSAGEGLPDATRLLWKQATGLHMLDGIGATELFHIFISSPGADVDTKRGSLTHVGMPGTPIGKVVPGYTAKVVGDDGHELPRGIVGKLAVIGPTACKYLDDARQSNYVIDGWNYPGDAFLQDTDGYFFYQARADDMIISAGYNIGGPEVEDCLLKHPAVAECGVIGKPDPERGMVVKAFCVLRSGFQADAAMVQTLQDHVKSQLAPYKYPREIEFLNTLPRTETGKLQRFLLRQPT
jgi:2-aminobenzoate-CoA ligase